jgi:hypothetical protein
MWLGGVAKDKISMIHKHLHTIIVNVCDTCCGKNESYVTRGGCKGQD